MNGLHIGRRAKNLRSLSVGQSVAVTPEEDHVLSTVGGLIMDRSNPDCVKISQGTLTQYEHRLAVADRRNAVQIYALYGEGGAARGTLPRWTESGICRRLYDLMNSSSGSVAGQLEARALEQYAGLPVTQVHSGRFKIDREALNGEKDRVSYFPSAEQTENYGPPPFAAHNQHAEPSSPFRDGDQALMAEPSGPFRDGGQALMAEPSGPFRDEGQALMAKAFALRQFQQEWSQPYGAPGDGAESGVVYAPGTFEAGAVPSSVGDVSMAEAWSWAPADMSGPMVMGDPAVDDVPALVPGSGDTAYLNPVATHAQSSRQTLEPTRNWQAQQTSSGRRMQQNPQSASQVYAPAGTAWFQPQPQPQPRSKGTAGR
ncbi:hypothetical protein [Streptomyces axinellae]